MNQSRPPTEWVTSLGAFDAIAGGDESWTGSVSQRRHPDGSALRKMLELLHKNLEWAERVRPSADLTHLKLQLRQLTADYDQAWRDFVNASRMHPSGDLHVVERALTLLTGRGAAQLLRRADADEAPPEELGAAGLPFLVRISSLQERLYEGADWGETAKELLQKFVLRAGTVNEELKRRVGTRASLLATLERYRQRCELFDHVPGSAT